MSVSPIDAKPLVAARGSVADFVELMKLRLASLVLVTTAVGFCVGYPGPTDTQFFGLLLHCVFGTALVAAGAMVLNQYMERETDALMERTMERPIPAGRITPGDALIFGTLLAISGIAYLCGVVNVLTGVLATLTIGSYLFAYTPLKTRTPLCTIVGAVPGAIPPMMGYAAATDTIDVNAWTLFAILFIWQMPHFLAIAWLYREDYARGRQLMLPVVDPTGSSTGAQTVLFSLALVPVTLAPTLLRMAGVWYFGAALLLGLAFLGCAVLVAIGRTDRAARQMFLMSVLYLPILLGFMVWDRAGL
jgi:protoheme IX farnesyltransferase